MRPGAPQDNPIFLGIGTLACLFIAFTSSLPILQIIAVVLAGIGIVQLARLVIAWWRRRDSGAGKGKGR